MFMYVCMHACRPVCRHMSHVVMYVHWSTNIIMAVFDQPIMALPSGQQQGNSKQNAFPLAFNLGPYLLDKLFVTVPGL